MTSRTDFAWVQVPEGQEIIPNIRSLAIGKDDETSSSDEEEISSSSSSDESSSTESEDSAIDADEEKEDARETEEEESSKLSATLQVKGKARRKSWSDQPLSIMWCLNSFETQPSHPPQGCAAVYRKFSVYQSTATPQAAQPAAAALDEAEPVAGPSGVEAGVHKPRKRRRGASGPAPPGTWRGRPRQRASSSHYVFSEDDSVDSSPETYRRARAAAAVAVSEAVRKSFVLKAKSDDDQSAKRDV